jgi:Uma2 family endonuclease
MAALREQTWMVEQYLELERTSEIKHEYLDGYVFAMTGASRNHNLIAAAVMGIFYVQLRGRPGNIYTSDQRVKAGRLYAYPDISVVCGTPEFTGETPDTLANPTLLIKVLSPSTEKSDRGKTFQYYRELDSLQEYVLIAQDSYRIEHYVRQENGPWLFNDAVGADATLELASIGCTLSLADVYEKVIFEEEETPSDDTG